jgi:hypothetical protein
MKLNFLGVPVYLNGRNYYIPSLAYPDFKANYALLTAPAGNLEGDALFAFMDARIPVIGLAVRRNYSEVTDEQLAAWLDMATLPLAIQAVAAASGIKPVSQTPEGEDEPAA